jgi:hypothetical protein
VDLKTAPMVMEELYHSYGTREREQLPTQGPIILCETTGMPWRTVEFRRKWRLVAKHAGVPDRVKNRDSVPAGMIDGGPERARVSQPVSLARISDSLRRRRR